MINDILVSENMVFRVVNNYLENKIDALDVIVNFGDASKFEKNPLRPKKVHWFFFKTERLINKFSKYSELFDDYPYFKINITQAKVMPYITYKLKSKDLIESDLYKEFKELYNSEYGRFLEKIVDKKSRSQCYRLKNTVLLSDLVFEDDVENWLNFTFNDVFEI